MDRLFKDEPVVLVDAYAWIFRAYYALPDFRNRAGQPTAAIHGFLSTLPKLAEFVKTRYGISPDLAIFFDRGGPQERLAVYAEYKANRPETPEDLKTQVPFIEEALSDMALPQVAINGVEADDAIASTALSLSKAGRRVFIASNDKDFFQILSGQINLIRPVHRSDEFVIYDPSALKKKYGLDPASMPDFYALVGDAVDNVPGVKGIGEKTAARLLQKYQTIDQIYSHLDDLPKPTSQFLKKDRDNAYLSRDLVRLKVDLVVEVIPVPLDPSRFDRPKLESLLSMLELRRLSEKLIGPETAPEAASSVPVTRRKNKIHG